MNVFLDWMTDGCYGSLFRVKKAEECFKQAREKASYNVKPKHATGIVRMPLITVWSQILFLTNTFHSVEETTLAPAVTYRDDCQTVLPVVNNSDPLFFFFCSTESKAGPKDLKLQMENDHHQAYCTSTV